MADITQQISSQFFNVKINKSIANLSTNDAVTVSYVNSRIEGLTIPTEAIDTTVFLRKTETNTMTGTADINFPNNTNSLVLNNGGITSSLPINLSSALNIASGMLNMSTDSDLIIQSGCQLRFRAIIGGEASTVINISDQGIVSGRPLELTSTVMNLKSSSLNLTNVTAPATSNGVKLTNENIELTNGASLNLKTGPTTSTASVSITNTGVFSSLPVDFTNAVNKIDKLQTKFLKIGDNWIIEEDPTTKNLLFKFKNPTTGIYELGVPFYAPLATTA